MTSANRIITYYLGAILLVSGSVKFVEPFKVMFRTQIEKSLLPLPDFAFVAGQASEILFGFLLLMLPMMWSRLPETVADRLLLLGHLAVMGIMLLAVYVHLHPAVPAEILPMEEKTPYLAGFTLMMVIVNAVIYRDQVEDEDAHEQWLKSFEGSK